MGTAVRRLAARRDRVVLLRQADQRSYAMSTARAPSALPRTSKLIWQFRKVRDGGSAGRLGRLIRMISAIINIGKALTAGADHFASDFSKIDWGVSTGHAFRFGMMGFRRRAPRRALIASAQGGDARTEALAFGDRSRGKQSAAMWKDTAGRACSPPDQKPAQGRVPGRRSTEYSPTSRPPDGCPAGSSQTKVRRALSAARACRGDGPCSPAGLSRRPPRRS